MYVKDTECALAWVYGGCSIQMGINLQPAGNIFENKYFTMRRQKHKTQTQNRSIEMGLFSLSPWFYLEKDYLSFVSNSGDSANVQAP